MGQRRRSVELLNAAPMTPAPDMKISGLAQCLGPHMAKIVDGDVAKMSHATSTTGGHPMKHSTILAMILLVVSLAACTRNAPDIQSDFDHSANFASFKTFGYASPLGTDVDGYPPLVTQSLKSATRRELEARGYRYVDSEPDLLVNFSARLADVGGVQPVQAQHIPYYGYRRVAVYTAWPSYAYLGNADKYTEGTINIDLVDARRKQLVWEGVAVGRVKDKKLTDPKPGIDNVVAEIFEKYTYRAEP